MTHAKLISIHLAGLLFFVATLSLFSPSAKADPPLELTGFDLQVKDIAVKCRDEITKEFERLLAMNRLNQAQLFDTFYVPIPNTYPQKYHTQYDQVTDETLRVILDKYLDMDKRFIQVIAVDVNGYIPTHNSKYTKPLTNDADYNTANNRTKRIVDHIAALAAARSTEPYILQKYNRDTGEQLYDLSVPIVIAGKHWGAVRIDYKPK
ncbi:MAG: hypothetical protein P4L42_01070 [Desulfocapsaceae bacterium]|nr:hypothetical protein [Desulfocapsaceae bacterium]